MAYVADRTRVMMHDRATADAWLSKVRRRLRVTPRTRIESATSKSTSATDTAFKDDTALSCVAVPMKKSALDLYGFNWSPCCIPLLDVGGTSGENGQCTVRERRRDWRRRRWYPETAGDEVMVREADGLYSHI